MNKYLIKYIIFYQNNYIHLYYFILKINKYFLCLFKFYINGVLQANNNAGAYTAPTITAIRFGYAYAGANYYWYGNHYLARMYNRALSDAEVLQNYNAQKTRFGLI